MTLFTHTSVGDTITASHLTLEDCSADAHGGGLNAHSYFGSLSIEDCDFINCRFTETESMEGMGGGLLANANTSTITVTGCQFIDCASNSLGGAMLGFAGGFKMSDCRVERCHTTSTGAVCLLPFADSPTGFKMSNVDISFLQKERHDEGCFVTIKFFYAHEWSSTTYRQRVFNGAKGCINAKSTEERPPVAGFEPCSPITLTNTLFVGNTVSDNPTYFAMMEAMKDAVQFADFVIEDTQMANPTDISINNCWTTTTPNSVGMYSLEMDEFYSYTYTRQFKDAFLKMGPYLTAKVEASADVVSRRIDVIVKGKVPLESQIYEMKLTEADGSNEMTGHLKFMNGVGSLLPSSKLDLKLSTTYTVTRTSINLSPQPNRVPQHMSAMHLIRAGLNQIRQTQTFKRLLMLFGKDKYSVTQAAEGFFDQCHKMESISAAANTAGQGCYRRREDGL
ncbi:hypothetical protein BLNAU_5162 [Blattamonas nauphoetae]|uniref:Right handed beta helix domain-containing protein n=1 Tax=Blattamonas nauphoetae TaxID=2049346 RepID=A0ABQ9Y894_9EUKA|nr:hypothetical protein BLNAU_5162 [Blattamonas nauphoetae]